MDNQQRSSTTWDVTIEEIEALIAGIDRPLITDLVKHSPHLQRHVFPGFRPSRLPWSQVPPRLAREVENNPARFDDLVEMWIASNEELLDEIADIPTEHLREILAELLARYGVENRLQVLWALRIDGREKIQEALEAGLAEEISDETSHLLSQAQQHVLALTLEAARAQVADLQNQLAEAKSDLGDNRRLLQRKNEQFENSQAEVERLQEEREQLKAQIEEQAYSLEALAAEQNRTREQLREEQAKTEELRRSVRDLKETLRVQMASSRQEETQHKLNDALLRLEEERKEAAELRLRLSKVEQKLEEAYAKRDAEQARSDQLVQRLQRLEYDKGVIIEEKRRLTGRVEKLQEELRSAREQLQERAINEVLARLPWDELDERWLEEREAVRDHLCTMIGAVQSQDDVASAPMDKWESWAQWMEVESTLLQDILTSLEKADEDSLNTLKQAQGLLTLRWYLLECTRQVILAQLQETLFTL